MPSRRGIVARIVTLSLLLLAVAAVAYFFYHVGPSHLLATRDSVRHSIDQHPIAAPLAFVGMYVLMTVLFLPVWWLQALAGYCFGILPAVIICQSGAACGAAAASSLSRWLAAEWFHARVEPRMLRLRALDEKLNNNGFLTVMVVRLTHVSPFGISNYLFGLLRIPIPAILLATLIGGIPTTAFYAALGAGTPLHDWRFITAMVGLNVCLLLGAAAIAQVRRKYVALKQDEATRIA